MKQSEAMNHHREAEDKRRREIEDNESRLADGCPSDKGGGVSESTPYKPMSIARKSGIGWNKGTKVLLLDDAEGTTWIMKGFQQGLKPQYTYEQFVAAGESQFKKLPPGWKFRIKTIEKDFIEVPEKGVATIMPDEFFNVYDKTGPGMSNYKP